MAGKEASSDFLAEASESLEVLSRDLLRLDAQRGQESDPELLNGIFRAAHSLKGLASMFGQERIAHLAHRFEDLLDALRLGKLALTDALLDALIEGLDVLQGLLNEAARGVHGPMEETALALQARLEALVNPAPVEAVDPLDGLELAPAVRAVFTEYEEHRLRDNARKGTPLFRLRAVFDLGDFDQKLAALNAALRSVGEVVSTLPSSSPGEEAAIAFDLIFALKKEQGQLDAVAAQFGAEVSALAARRPARPKPKRRAKPPPPVPEPEPVAPPYLQQLPDPGPTPLMTLSGDEDEEDAAELTVPFGAALGKVSAEPSLRSLTQTVRVDIARLDALMNAVGELLVVRQNISRIAEQATAQSARLWSRELTREARALERKLDEVQEGILAVRMVPLGQVFDKLARLVKRLIREAGREIDFDLSGGDVELDKLIVEELSDPLMHLIRNAIDHGVEAPAERLRAGKPRRGRIRLKAREQGNHVVLEVGDDGAGLDEQRIREVAVARGLLTDEGARALDRRELFNLIFLPGFSTRREVSELSGRGVGMDVVKTNLARLSGLIDVASEPGFGTAFTLTLPLTLAIIRALVVQVSGRTYAIPLNSVLEIVSASAEELRTIGRREVLQLRGQTLPFARLARLFGHPEHPADKHFVVVVGLAQQRLGLAVDQLVGQQDVVVKPLGGRLQGLPGVAGATDLGDRRAVLVLDVGSLIDVQRRARAVVAS